MTTAGAPLALLLVVAIIAISKSPNKGLAALYIFGWTLAGLALGAAIGYAAGSPAAAGGLAGICALIMGIGTSIKKISDNRKAAHR